MSQLVARILLALFVFPIGLLAFFVSMVVMETQYRGSYGRASEQQMLMICGSFTWAMAGGYWLLLWWRQVRWTSTRITATILLVPLMLVLCILVTIAFSGIERIVGYGLSCIIAPMGWLMGTILVWRETKAERAARISGTNADAVTCPTCGYNLTGLSDTRCPECGAKFTLNELFARQPDREAAKLDQEISG